MPKKSLGQLLTEIIRNNVSNRRGTGFSVDLRGILEVAAGFVVGTLTSIATGSLESIFTPFQILINLFNSVVTGVISFFLSIASGLVGAGGATSAGALSDFGILAFLVSIAVISLTAIVIAQAIELGVDLLE